MRAYPSFPRPPASIGFVKVEGSIKFRARRATWRPARRTLRAASPENVNDVRTIVPSSGGNGTEPDSPLSRRKAESAGKTQSAKDESGDALLPEVATRSQDVRSTSRVGTK
jgi:hypothetical protein